MKTIRLTTNKKLRCKCPIREYIGDDGKQYWLSKGRLYSTDPHTPGATRAVGHFTITSTQKNFDTILREIDLPLRDFKHTY